MKLGNLAIIAFLALLFIGCEDSGSKKDTFDEQNASAASKEEAVLTEDYSRLFTLTLTNGSSLNMQKTDKGFNIDNNNKASLFVFFNTWCPPCKVEIPALNSLQEKFKHKLDIVGVLIEDKPLNEILDFMKTYDVSYNVAYGDENNFFANALNGVIGIPYMVLYNQNGNFINEYLGIIPEEMLESDIQRIFL